MVSIRRVFLLLKVSHTEETRPDILTGPSVMKKTKQGKEKKKFQTGDRFTSYIADVDENSLVILGNEYNNSCEFKLLWEPFRGTTNSGSCRVTKDDIYFH